MEKKPITDKISVMVIYSRDKEGNIVYDYEEMCQHFAFRLSLLNNEKIEIEVTNKGEPLAHEMADYRMAQNQNGFNRDFWIDYYYHFHGLKKK